MKKIIIPALVGLMILLFFAAALSAPESRDNKGSIKVVVDGFQSDKGFAKIGLCNTSESFKNSEERAIFNTTVHVEAGRVVHIFRNVPFGIYAVTVYHDENGNGKLDKGMFGRPVELYGFSQNARERFSRPAFEKAAFALDQAEMTVRVTVQ